MNTFVRELPEDAVSRRGQERRAVERFLALAELGTRSRMNPGTIRRDELDERL